MSESLTAPEQPFSWKAFLTKKRYFPKWLVASMKWLFLGFVALCILWVGFRYFFGMQFDTLQLARFSREDLSLIPLPLGERSTVPAIGSYDAYGYTFQLPWKDAKPLDKFGRESSTTILAPERVMMISNPYRRTNALDILREMPAYSGDFFSRREFPTNYALLRAELYSSPQNIRYFSLPRNAQRNCILVQLKWFELVPDEAQTIAAIDTPFVHGFEYRGKRGITLKLFDSNDRLLEVRFLTMRTSIPQSEINTFITSLRPASEAGHD